MFLYTIYVFNQLDIKKANNMLMQLLNKEYFNAILNFKLYRCRVAKLCPPYINCIIKVENGVILQFFYCTH